MLRKFKWIGCENAYEKRSRKSWQFNKKKSLFCTKNSVIWRTFGWLCSWIWATYPKSCIKLYSDYQFTWILSPGTIRLKWRVGPTRPGFCFNLKFSQILVRGVFECGDSESQLRMFDFAHCWALVRFYKNSRKDAKNDLHIILGNIPSSWPSNRYGKASNSLWRRRRSSCRTYRITWLWYQCHRWFTQIISQKTKRKNYTRKSSYSIFYFHGLTNGDVMPIFWLDIDFIERHWASINLDSVIVDHLKWNSSKKTL